MRKYLSARALRALIAFLILVTVCLQSVSFAADNNLLTEINYIVSFYKDAKYNECIASADSLLKSDNSFMEAYRYKALSYFKQKKYDKAIEVLQAQLKLNPNNEFALYNSACLYSLVGNEKQAEDCLKMVMSLNVANKKGIKKDLDFDNIKDNIIFKNIEGITVRVNGQVLFFDVLPITINDRTMLPMRGIFEAMGAEIEWNGETQTVTAVKGETTVAVTVGSNMLTVNGVEKEIDTAAVLKDDRTLVPVRFVSEALGAEVTWNENDEIVEILTKAPQGNANYEDVINQIDKLVDISPIDGTSVEPYSFSGREAKMLIIAKDKEALELLSSLTDGQRAMYMCKKTNENLAEVAECEPIYMEFIYNKKAYYTGKYVNDNNAVALVYYENGLDVNTVIQDKQNFNYKDYYTKEE